MKTNGIPPYVHAKNGILSILAILIAAPVLAQISYASLTNNALTGISKELAAMSSNYNGLPAPYLTKSNAEPVVFFASSHENNNRTVKALSLTENNEAAKNINSGKYFNDLDIKNLEVSLKPTGFVYPINSRADAGLSGYSSEQVIFYAKALKKYAKENGFDTTYVFLSNMAMRCNKKRFFVINLTTMSIEQTGLVSNGRGMGSIYDRQYSNMAGSRCTSLGRYKISGKYRGGYGESYKLIGLDSSNKNAYNRNIVLHSMMCIPDMENSMPACVSDGCPAVSTKFLASLRKIISSRKKPMLLWIFDSNLEELVVKVHQPKIETKTITQNSSWNPPFRFYSKLIKKYYSQRWRRIIEAPEFGWCSNIKNKSSVTTKSSNAPQHVSFQNEMRQFYKSKIRKSFNKLFFSYYAIYKASDNPRRNKIYRQYKKSTAGKLSSGLRNKTIKRVALNNKTA